MNKTYINNLIISDEEIETVGTTTYYENLKTIIIYPSVVMSNKEN